MFCFERIGINATVVGGRANITREKEGVQVSMSELLDSGTISGVGLPRLHGLANKLSESKWVDSENMLSEASSS